MRPVVPVGYVSIHQAVDYVGKHLFRTKWSADNINFLRWPLPQNPPPQLEEAVSDLQNVLASDAIQATALAEDGQEYDVPRSLWKNALHGRNAIYSGLLPLNLLDGLAVKPRERKRPHIFVLESDLEKVLKGMTLPANRGRKARQKAGGKPRYNWPAFKSEVKRLLRHHGMPDASDPEFSSKRELVRMMKTWCLDNWHQVPAESTLENYIDESIAEYEDEFE